MPVTLRSGHTSFDIDPDRCRPHRATTGRRSRIGGAGPQHSPVRATINGNKYVLAIKVKVRGLPCPATGPSGLLSRPGSRARPPQRICAATANRVRRASRRPRKKRNRSAYKCTSSDGRSGPPPGCSAADRRPVSCRDRTVTAPGSESSFGRCPPRQPVFCRPAAAPLTVSSNSRCQSPVLDAARTSPQSPQLQL